MFIEEYLLNVCVKRYETIRFNVLSFYQRWECTSQALIFFFQLWFYQLEKVRGNNENGVMFYVDDYVGDESMIDYDNESV